ncbi:lamin tail domain-containing protein [bacterium]|nr:lamin tail domain-containing protein [bacterium]
MKRSSVPLYAFALLSPVITAGLASAVPYFHTDFDEATLGAISGLNIDTPNTNLGTGNSGTVSLDTVNQTLDLAANGANTWTAREGAPIAWVAAPVVASGEKWFVQAQITHTNGSGVNSTYDQAGITFYSGNPGANPGSENSGTHESLFFGINNWNAWEHKVQGFSDNNPAFGDAANTGDGTFEYRVEVTENGTSDLYNFFYREDSADPWSQLGTPDLSQDFDNTAVGLFLKSHNNNTTASTEFDYLTVDIINDLDITDPTDTDSDGIGDDWETFYFGDLSRDGTLDFDSDGRTDVQEWGDGTNPTEADIDGDGLNDGEEFSFGTDPLDDDSDGDGWDDGEEIAAGSDPNNSASAPLTAPEPEVYASLPQPVRDAVVVFSEIHYHPAGDDIALEYVELHNLMAVDVDMSNWRLFGDFDFDFPEGTVLAAGDYLVVASNPAALQAETGFGSALGPFTGSLSNSGGRLRLYNNNRSFQTLPGGAGSPGEILDDQEGRRIMDEVEYGDVFPWPVAADGSGATLMKRQNDAGSAHAVNWTASVAPNGSPGIANPQPIKAQVAINEVTASSDVPFRLELYNYGNSTVQLGGMVLSSSDTTHADYVLPAAALAPGGFLEIDSAALGYTPSDNNRLFLFAAGKGTLIDGVRVDDSARARQPDGSGRWLRPDVPTLGSANSFDISTDVVINEIFYNPPSKSAVPGLPGGVIEHEVLDFNSNWRYNLDAGTVGLPVDWANTAHSVDGTSWDQGPGLLGFESSVLGEPLLTTLTRVTKVPYYFETEFVYTGTGSVSQIQIDHYIDDGAVFYLNGVEIDRFNIPSGTISPSTEADPGVTDAVLQTLTVNDAIVVNGTNRLSVEVHQSSAGSSDMVFGAKVTLFEEDGSGTPGQPYTERGEEWIELYNRGAVSLVLTDWKLGGGIDYDFPVGTTIPAGGYLVIAKDAAALAAKHPTITIIGDYDQRLGNGGDLVILEDANGNPADEVRYYDSGKWHGKADGGGASLELRDPDADNRFASVWASSDETARSSWKTYTYEGVAIDDGLGDNIYHELQIGFLDAGEVLIDDVSVVENDSIEFMQNGDFESDSVDATADKWRAIGTHGSHGKTVVVTDPEDPGNKCLHLVSTGPTENKHNKLETTFANSQEVVVGNTYRIQFRAKFLSGVPLLNTRLYFNYLQRTHILDRPTVWGTPGMPNSTVLANAGPTLSGLEHSPAVPDAGEATTVSLDASDLDGINQLTLFYSVNGGSFQSVGMSLGGNGRFEGVIPGQSASTIVRFYVRAEDNSSGVSFLPVQGTEGGAFYKVQDGLAHTQGIRQNLRIIMSEADRQFLFLNTNRMSNDRFPVTVIEGESTVYYNVGARLKASGHGRFQANGYGFNLRFQPDNLFRGAHRSISLERTGGHNELFAKHLLNRAGGGYWSFYDDVAHLVPPTANDRGSCLISMGRQTGNYFDGLFPDTDESGTLFNLELHYSPNGTTGGPEGLKVGNPYNHNYGHYDFEDRGSDKEPYRWGFQIRSARDRDDYSKIVALNQAFDLTGAEFKAAMDELIDVDQWMRSFAMLSLNGNDDTFGRIWDHNIRFYVRPTDGKVLVMPWDLDRCFRLGTSGSLTTGLQSAFPSTRDARITRSAGEWSIAQLYEIPQYRRLFEGHLEDLVKTTTNSSYLSSWSSHLGSVAGANFSQEMNYLTNRSNFVLGSVPSPVTFAITTNSGSNFSVTDSVASLEGEAWVDVFSIQVNGIETPITWIDGETWQIDVPVQIGSNALTIAAFNNRGTEVASNSISITNTGNVALADASNTVISELHYHTPDPSAAEMTEGYTDEEEFEFVEIANIHPVNEVDLTNVSFTDGVIFTFPFGTTLAPGERILVVSNQAAFEFRYGNGVGVIAGSYTGNLRNSGEHVRLEAADDLAIADFTYGEESEWPLSADGDGYSLVFSGSDPGHGPDWRSSVGLGGNPGGSDAVSLGGGDLFAYALAAQPKGESNNDAFLLNVRMNLGADDTALQAYFSTDLENWVPVSITDFGSRTNNGDGTETLLIRSNFPISTTPKQFGRIEIEER